MINRYISWGYLVATALYAAAFAEYANALVGDALPAWAIRLCGVMVVVVFSLVNLLSTQKVGRAASLAMGFTIVALIVFSVAGAFKIQPAHLSLPTHDWHGILVAAGVLYVNYQGFGVVTNASGAMKNPAHELPRAMFLALGVVVFIYVIVSIVTVGIWPVAQIEDHSGHVLANIAQSIWGAPGLILISASALLATAAAVNATIFAASHIARDTAKQGALPNQLTRAIKGVPTALLFSATLVALMVVALPLTVVGQMASLAFLLVYAFVTIGHWRIADKTGARRSILVAAVCINLLLFALLFHSAWHLAPVSAYALIGLLVGSGSIAPIAQFLNHRRS